VPPPEEESVSQPPEAPPQEVLEPEEPVRMPRLKGRGKGSPRSTGSLVRVDTAAEKLQPAQRLLILDTWQRSGLPAGDFADLVGMGKHTLYAWKKRFEECGPGGLMDRAKGKTGSKLPDLTKRSILMLKQGCAPHRNLMT